MLRSECSANIKAKYSTYLSLTEEQTVPSFFKLLISQSFCHSFYSSPKVTYQPDVFQLVGYTVVTLRYVLNIFSKVTHSEE